MSFDIPEWLSRQLEFDRDNDLQQGHVAEAMYHGDRPYYSLRHLARKLDFDFSRDTIGTRLDEMTEAGALDRERVNNGDVWWIKHEESDWPVPPDVRVGPRPDEPTISEFIRRPEILVAFLSVLGAAGSGAIVWGAALQSTGSISLPFGTTRLLAIALYIISVSYLGIFVSILLWILQQATGKVIEV